MISVEVINKVLQVKIGFDNKMIIDCVFHLPGAKTCSDLTLLLVPACKQGLRPVIS